MNTPGMWPCEACGRIMTPQRALCWHCGTPRDRMPGKFPFILLVLTAIAVGACWWLIAALTQLGNGHGRWLARRWW
jgi:hypothetical protein